jgi:hypothetical protein
MINYFIDIPLMKRDYLNLIKYYYKIDYNIAINIFDKYIINNIVSKDLDFIIENKLFLLIKKLDGIFIKTSINSYQQLINDNLKLYYLETYHCNQIISYLNLNYINNPNKKYNVIIDGGNILYARNGIININDFMLIIKKIVSKYNSILVIIHQKYCTKFPILIEIMKELSIDYYLTPYNMNDDIFIIWFFLKMQTKAFIITNDKFRDHVYDFAKYCDYNLFINILHQQTLNYNILTLLINDEPKYSICIQKIDNNIYVPQINGRFILINY